MTPLISAKVLKYSISPSGERMLSMEIEYPRLILAELNTHRMLSKNSASSRAIPFAKMREQLTGAPVRMGAAAPGMQDKGEHDARVPLPREATMAFDLFNIQRIVREDRDFTRSGSQVLVDPHVMWEFAKWFAEKIANGYFEAKYHKQVFNRLLEPWQKMKTVISGTEWGNFFVLRQSSAADPTIQALATAMREAVRAEAPMLLHPGEWHLPYVDTHRSVGGSLRYSVDGYEVGVRDAQVVSVARCAAVSYRNTNYDVQRCWEVWQKLATPGEMHGSAFEHQASPLSEGLLTWADGQTHIDARGRRWSGNLHGWQQLRKTLDGECADTPWWQ